MSKEKFPEQEKGVREQYPSVTPHEQQAFKEALQLKKERLEGELRKINYTLRVIEEGVEIKGEKPTYTYDELLEISKRAQEEKK